MTYALTAHAQLAMKDRVIAMDWLEAAIQAPERMEPDPMDPDLVHHLKRIPEHGNRVLRVVLNKIGEPNRVVTVYFDRSMKGKL